MVFNNGEQRHLNNLQQTLATVVTESVAAVMAPSMDNNNPHYMGMPDNSTTTSTSVASTHSGRSNNSSHQAAYDAPASGLMYWSGDGGGGGGGVGFGANHRSGLSIEGSGDVFVESLSNSIDYFNATHFPYDRNATDYYEPTCQMYLPGTNISYWNVTCDTPVDYIVPLYGYCMPFLLIVTVLSNSLIVLILSKKNMSTPTNFVLMGMAICDMLTVIFPAPGLWYMYTFGNHYKPLHPVSLCLTYNIFNEIMPAMCHTASIWLTLALAVQRYIYVCHAPMARTWCTMPRVKRCTLYIALAAFLHQSTRFFDRAYIPLTVEWNGQMVEVCRVETAHWVQYVGEDLYFTSYFLFRVLFVHLLPCIILVTLNILLFSAMRQAQERRKLLFRENRKKECKKLRESNCTTLMLIVVVTVFLIVEIPIAVVTAMHIVSSLIIAFLDYQIANIFITFTNFFLVVSYPINFGIYCGMSRQFRETFKEIFLGRMIAKKDNSSRYSIVNGPRTCTNTNETVL